MGKINIITGRDLFGTTNPFTIKPAPAPEPEANHDGDESYETFAVNGDEVIATETHYPNGDVHIHERMGRVIITHNRPWNPAEAGLFRRYGGGPSIYS